VSFADEYFSLRRVRSDILCPLRRKPICAKNVINSHGQKSRVFLFASISRRTMQTMFFMQISMDGSVCDSRLCVRRKEKGESKHWRYDSTELLSHASMPVFGRLVNTLTRINLHDKLPPRVVFSSEPQPKHNWSSLRTFPHTAVDALSSSLRLIFPSRAPTRKTTSCRMRAVSIVTLYGMTVVSLCSAARTNVVLQIVMSTITVV
jgi:hypothetical protein